ncbi:cobaltochelatase CobN subunit [Hathewaya proteolytica DSM 3090]|uniref:Cobaltochelatase CobN subunit n=1 Tax=Hathewaya proteolytica DSM 3090 TaxID=1121331 RepID=A0A1M6KA62_9CLOT|nr:cobaltochelatase subunit CobN [Hathewaya proteolytica]SHJ55826.1 cobaltochelatase CobN subunit [Hathewaya proteolytica DSM 3090]
MKITIVTVSVTAVKSLIEVGNQIKEQFGNVLNLKLYYAVSKYHDEKLKNMVQDIEDSDLVFVDLMGSPQNVVQGVYKGLEKAKGHIVPYGNSAREYMRLGKFTAESMSSKKNKNSGKPMDMATMKKMQSMAETMGKIIPGKMRDMRNYSYIMKYFSIASKENMMNMLYLILREYGNIKNVPKPQEPKVVDNIFLCNPETMEMYDDRGTVAMIFSGKTYPTDTSICVESIRKRLCKEFNVVSIAVCGNFDEYKDKLKNILVDSGQFNVDLMLNFMPFRLGAGPMGGDFQAGINLLKDINVPYLHPFFMTRRHLGEYEESAQGCTASETLISVMLPELDGAMETYPIAVMTEPEYNGDYDVYTDELSIMEDRLERLVGRVRNHIRLRQLKNSEKKVAIICYNYPPGESNLFGGAFLDTFASVENILRELKQQGYTVNDISKEELMHIFTIEGVVNSGRYSGENNSMILYSSEAYKEEIQKDKTYGEMIEQWGEVPGTVMVGDNKNFFIPGTVQGNVFIGLQPSRGIHENVEKAYHDKTLLPHHQYQGFYKWLRDEYKADAIIHVGTHGTLEFLKGKECGISSDCYGDKLLGDIPHMYLYYCGNPSEAVIAKRRSNANLISYEPPVFVQGELYGDYAKLMSLVDNYHQSLAIAPQNSEAIMKDIHKWAEVLNLPRELEELECELYRMNTSLIPKGLHVFGKGFSEEEAREYAKGILRYSGNGITSLKLLVGRALGYSDELINENLDYEVINNIFSQCNRVFNVYMDKGALEEIEFVNEENKEEFIKTLEYGKKIHTESQKNYEIRGIVRTLSGKFNEAALAGDIYRSPEVLPAGYNLYQFDPRLVPTKTAYERGQRICNNTIMAYKSENGTYPQSTAVILWGLETSRTQGETFAQILSYLGVRMVETKDKWDAKFEIIPLEELGRPRIDVTINICGFFRDMFPNLMDVLQDIFNELYELDESTEDNYFKANSERIYMKLISEGYDEKEARELAVSRIFGPKEGEYGTGITSIIETKNWQCEEQIGNAFLNSLQHVYTKNMRGREVKELYKENLKSVDLVSQTRSNHEYEITDLDHYYEFFGGLSKSVEMVKGKKAKMYITDTTGEKIFTESVDKSIARGIRTRVLNPKWIDGMLNHKYHGVQKIADRFENVLGLAATTNSVDQWIYNDMYKCYVEDEELSERLKENNPYAYMDIVEYMVEYNERNYWQASEEQIKKLKEKYLELEDNIEDKM